MPAEPDEEVARRESLEASLKANVEMETLLRDVSSNSVKDDIATQSRDIRHVVTEGRRTISSWKNPLVEEDLDEEKDSDGEHVHGRGAVFDIYIESRLDGTVTWLDETSKFAENDSSPRDSDQSVHNQATQSDGGTKISTATRRRRKKQISGLRKGEVVRMQINSPLIKSAIRSIANYYPSQILTGKFIAIDAPFEILWHCHQGLRNLLDESSTYESLGQMRGEASPEGTDIATRNRHIKVLLNYLEPKYRKTIKPMEDRHQEGVSSFDTLWLLFKPGCDAYARVGGVLGGFVIRSAKQDVRRYVNPENGDERIEPQWIITAWNLSYSRGKFGRVSHSFKIDKFEGEKEIISLEIFPSHYLDSSDHFKTRNNMVTRGKAYFERTQNVPVHLGYQGPTWEPQQKRPKKVRSTNFIAKLLLTIPSTMMEK